MEVSIDPISEEEVGHRPFLVHARKAKLMMREINKTDKLKARGLALLLRNGTIPSVWIPLRASRSAGIAADVHYIDADNVQEPINKEVYHERTVPHSS